MTIARSVTHTEDAIYEAVEHAIDEGWDPRRFVREASAAWDSRLREQQRDAHREFARMLQPRFT